MHDRGTPGAVQNLMTVDVEDWFHILEAEGDGAPAREAWEGLESRVERNTDKLLQLFADAGTEATFFVVGWVADRQPDLVRRIADAGHELASHSYWHQVIPLHSQESLRQDLARSRKTLEDVSGQAVAGFRAPGSSLTPDVAWAFDVILEAGFAYDSSLCPGVSSHGGYPSSHLGPHRVRCAAGELIEIPSSTAPLFTRRVPYAGGGYLRLFPGALIRHCIHRDNLAGRPANVYVHPREIDPEQPRMELPLVRRFKYYVGLRSTGAKLRSLLRDHSFTSIRRWLALHAPELEGQVLDVREAVRHSRPPMSGALPGAAHVQLEQP